VLKGAPPTIEERHAHLTLELLDLSAQWRLRHTQLFRCPREASFGDYCHEVAEVAKLHSIPLGYGYKPLSCWSSQRPSHPMGMGEATRQCNGLARPPNAVGLTGDLAESAHSIK
jgi:hypothetical protein